MNGADIRDCAFKDECAVYNDPMIPATWKGPGGRGCRWQADAYRAGHCKAFRCKALAESLLAARPARPQARAELAKRPQESAPEPATAPAPDPLPLAPFAR